MEEFDEPSEFLETKEYTIDKETFGRVGPARFTEFDKTAKKIYHTIATDQEKLETFIRLSFQLITQEIKNIAENDLNIFIGAVSKFSKPQYLNSNALILSYYILDKGQISKKKFNEMSARLNSLEQKDIYITQMDLIRYARLWIAHL